MGATSRSRVRFRCECCLPVDQLQRSICHCGRDFEFEDSLVPCVGDVQVPAAIKRHTVWMEQAPVFFSRPFDGEEKFSGGCKTLHTVIQTADVHTVVAVDGNADRPDRVGEVAEFVAAESAQLISFVAPGREKFTGGGKFLHAALCTFGRVDAAVTILRNKMRPAEPLPFVTDAVKLPGSCAIFPPAREQFAIPRELLDAMIALIGDEQMSFGRENDATRLVKLPRLLSLLTPLPHLISAWRKNADLMLNHEREINEAVVADGDAADHRTLASGGIARRVEFAKEFAARRKCLHAGVVQIGAEEDLFGIKGQSDGGIKFAGLIAPLAPFVQEAGRSRLVSEHRPQPAREEKNSKHQCNLFNHEMFDSSLGGRSLSPFTIAFPRKR